MRLLDVGVTVAWASAWVPSPLSPAAPARRLRAASGADDLYPSGCDASVFAADAVLEAGDLEALAARGWVVKDDALPVDELCRALTVLEDVGGLESAAQPGVRDDLVRFVDEERCMLPVRPVVRALKGVAHSMNGFPRLVDEADASTPLAPATAARPITCDRNVMIASYGPGGRYRIHSDNSNVGDDGASSEKVLPLAAPTPPPPQRRNFRAFTAILYANPDWNSEDGGALRLWPRSHDIDAADDEDQLRASLRATWAARRREGDSDDGEYIDVEPRAGRLVVFDARLLHEVRTNTARARRALTCWLLRPQTPN